MPRPSLMQLVNRAHRALMRDGDAQLQPLGFRYAQVPVFVYLLAHGEGTQKALAEACGIEQPSMAQLLARMERDGLVRSRPNPDDARSRLVALGRPDDPRLAQGRERLAELEARCVAGFSAEEVRTLRALLERLQHNLDGVATS